MQLVGIKKALTTNAHWILTLLTRKGLAGQTTAPRHVHSQMPLLCFKLFLFRLVQFKQANLTRSSFGMKGWLKGIVANGALRGILVVIVVISIGGSWSRSTSGASGSLGS